MLQTFNRTILELKHNQTLRIRRVQGAFNRTILELKQTGVVADFIHCLPFNRTILELKLHIHNTER